MSERTEEDAGGEEGEGGRNGTAGVPVWIAPESRFALGLAWEIRPRFDTRMRIHCVSQDEAKTCFNQIENDTGSRLRAADIIRDSGAIAIVFIVKLRGNFTIYLRLDTGAFLVFRGGVWQSPEYASFPDARDAVLATLTIEDEKNALDTPDSHDDPPPTGSSLERF